MFTGFQIFISGVNFFLSMVPGLYAAVNIGGYFPWFNVVFVVAPLLNSIFTENTINYKIVLLI